MKSFCRFISITYMKKILSIDAEIIDANNKHLYIFKIIEYYLKQSNIKD